MRNVTKAPGARVRGFASRPALAACGGAAGAALLCAALGAGARSAEADTSAVVKGALRTKVALELVTQPQTMTGAMGAPNPVYYNTLDRDVIVTLVYGDQPSLGVNGTGGGPLQIQLSIADLNSQNVTPVASNDNQGAGGASILVPARKKLLAMATGVFSWTLVSAKLVGDGY